MNRKPVLILALSLGAAALPGLARAACTATQGDFDGNGTTDLRIVGTGAKQRIVLDVEAAQTLVSISCNGDPDFIDAGDLNQQPFAGNFDLYDIAPGGSDIVTFNLAQSLSGASKLVRVLLLGGNNVVSFTAAPGVVLSGQSRLVAEVAGYLSSDTVELQAPDLNASGVLLRGDLSIGNDTVRVTLGNMSNGALLDVDATLSSGNNFFELTQRAGTTITNSTVDLIAEGSNGGDKFTAALNGVAGAGARLRFTGDLADSNDTFLATLDLATFRVLAGGEVVLDVRGGNGTDKITVTRNGTAGGAAATLAGVLDLRLAGGLLTDTLAVDLAGGGFAMNGGRLRLRAEGGAANDLIDVKLQADASSTNPIFDVHLHGGPQTDTLTLDLQNGGPNAAANFGPAGQVLVDGSHGVDACAVTGNALQKIRNCE
jgi:hypothetical protein